MEVVAVISYLANYADPIASNSLKPLIYPSDGNILDVILKNINVLVIISRY